MKKLIPIVAIFAAIGIGVFLGSVFISAQSRSGVALGVKDKSSNIPTPSPSPVPGIPNKLTISSVKVSADVESVALDEKNRMDVPKNVNNVAWYNLGSKPGAQGNAVLSGHLDKTDGSPAVFYNLSQINIGDTITVEDSNQNTFHYKVTNIQTYRHDQVPLKEIFGEAQGTFLNLITCEGSFDNASQNYSHRTVVYSTIVSN